MNIVKKIAMLRIAGIIALIAAAGFTMITCGTYFDPRGGGGTKSSGNNPGDTGDPGASHTHTYAAAWSFNATQHWRECTANDGAKTDEADHTGTPCSVCGYWWTAVANSTFTGSLSNIRDIAYGGGKFVAVEPNNGRMAYSSDGANWTAITSHPFPSQVWSIAYGNNTFVAGGNGTSNNGIVMAYSSDGVTWTGVQNSTFSNTAWPIYGIAYGNNTFVAVGTGARITYSTDNGATWTAATLSGVREGIAYGSNRFVAVGASGQMAYSSDGQNWTAVSDSTFGTSQINDIAYANNRFVAVGNSGKMAYSDNNGVTWTAVANSTFGTSAISRIAYGNNRWVAVGASGKMAYSDNNGVTWTAIANSTFGTSSIRGIAYGNNRFVAVGNDGKMAYADW